MKKFSYLFLCAWIILTAGLTLSSQPDETAKKVKCPGKVAVLIETIKPAIFLEYQYFSGQGQAEIVTIKSPVGGLLSEIKVSEGSLVDVDQDLVVLNAGITEEIKKLAAAAAKTEKILTVRQNWKVKNEKAIQAAAKDYQKALDLLNEKKAMANQIVKAPLAGTVHLLMAAGSETSADALLLEISNPRQMLFQIPLTASENGLFSVGDKIAGTTDGFNGEVAAEVIVVSEVQATLRVNNYENQVKEGVTFTFRKLKTEHADAIAIPTIAIQKDSLGDCVYVADKKKAKKLFITLGAATGEKTMVLKGLAADTQLIISGFECLANDKKIRIVAQEELAKEKAEALTKKEAEALAKEKTEALAKEKVEARAKKKAEALAKKEAEAQAKEKAEALAKEKAQARSKEKAEAQAKKKAEAQAKKKAEALAKKEAEALAKLKEKEATLEKKIAEPALKTEAPAAVKKTKCPGKVAVPIETIKQATFLEYQYFSGQGQAEIVAIKSPVKGLLSEIKVSEGSLVEAEQELAVLNAGMSEEIKKLAAAAAKMKKILTVRQNWKVKNEKAIQAAAKDYQKALDLLNEKMALANQIVKAPVAGTVHLIMAVGSEMTADAVLMEITNPRQMLFQISLTASEKGLFSVGEKIVGTADGFNGEVAAEVIVVSEVRATLRVNNYENQVKEGVTFTFKKLKADHANAIAIPTMAIQKDSLGDFVYVVDKKKAKKLYITLGAAAGDRTMVLKGLAADMPLIISGFECLANGKKIRIVNQEELAIEKAEAPTKLKEKEGTQEEKKVMEPEVKTAAAAAGVEDFIAYLEANKETLQFDHYKKTEVNGLAAVKIYSGPEAQKKLLDIIGQFAIKEIGFELKDGLIVSTITFKKAEQIIVEKKLSPKESRIRRLLLGIRLGIGVHGTYYLMQGKNFKDAYGELAGFGAELSFRFTPKIDFWVSGGMANKKAPFAGTSEEMQFKMIPLSAAIRYYLLDKGKLSAFVGAGPNVFLVNDKNSVGDIKKTVIGFNALAGSYYQFSRKIFAQLFLKFNLVQKDLYPDSELDDPLNLSGLELNLGVGILL